MQPDLLNTFIVFALTSLCAAGVLGSLLYPRTAKARLFESRFDSIAVSGDRSGQASSGSDSNRRKRSVEETLRELAEKQEAKNKQRGAKPSLARRMRQAQLGWSRKTYLVVSILSGAFAFAAAILSGIDMAAAAGFGLTGGLLLPHFYVSFRRARRFKRFSAEFPTAVDVIVRGIKSGLPVSDCFRIIATETPEPVRGEFKAIVEDQMLGIPLDEAVQRFAERVPLSETNFFAIVVGIQSRTGGSLAEALGNLSKVLRERKKMHAKIRAMSAEAKASGGIIGCLPVVVAGLVYLTSPDYISLLATETLGNIVLAASGLWMCVGILVMRKMISFDF